MADKLKFGAAVYSAAAPLHTAFNCVALYGQLYRSTWSFCGVLAAGLSHWEVQRKRATEVTHGAVFIFLSENEIASQKKVVPFKRSGGGGSTAIAKPFVFLPSLDLMSETMHGVEDRAFERPFVRCSIFPFIKKKKIFSAPCSFIPVLFGIPFLD